MSLERNSLDSQGDVSFKEDANSLLITWDNRKCRTDSFLKVFFILFWLVWTPATIFMTWQLIKDPDIFTAVWLLFGWTGTILIPFILRRLWMQEWIRMNSDEISWGYGDPIKSKKKMIAIHDLNEVTYGYVPSNDGDETTPTLNLWMARKGRWGYRPREILAYWLHKEHKKAIFDCIGTFITQRGIALTVREHHDYE